MEIVKKCTKIFFEEILSGKKNFDVRLADFECKEEDILVLKEIDDNKNFTGRVQALEHISDRGFCLVPLLPRH